MLGRKRGGRFSVTWVRAAKRIINGIAKWHGGGGGRRSGCSFPYCVDNVETYDIKECRNVIKMH